MIGFWINLLIGGTLLILVDDIRWYLFFTLAIILATLEYLRKLIRIFQITNEVKLISIIKKLGISKKDLEKVWDETESKLSEKQKKSIMKDFDGIS